MKEYSIKIIVATHKQYQMPNDPIYIPLHVGADGKKTSQGEELDLGYVKDNSGDNISNLNASFCELTGLYWAWKNLDYDYVGLCHYRRYFSLHKKSGFQNVLTDQDIRPFLGKIKVFVPKKRHYYIESLYSHYKHTHYANQLDVTRKIISEIYPEYIKSYDRVLKHTYGYMFNMMIMDKMLFNEYCNWLFTILFCLKKQDMERNLNDFQKRFYGRISEIIFNVWIDYKVRSGELHKENIKEIPCIHMEKINWLKKGSSFLAAKFLGHKYNKSF